jgi:alpha/beta superfamily hydrolase
MAIPISDRSEDLSIEGPAGRIEVVIDFPEAARAGVALVAHPHPLFGGTLDNKVVQTLAKTMLELGFVTLRANFRGVGASEGSHDDGAGETDDLVHVLEHARERFGAAAPVLCGYSFGAYVQARVAQRVAPSRMVLVGVANGHVTGGRDYATPAVPADTIVIHGELDETVPLANVLDWARPQELPVVVIPGADHFFHRRLHIIRGIVLGNWSARADRNG